MTYCEDESTYVKIEVVSYDYLTLYAKQISLEFKEKVGENFICKLVFYLCIIFWFR